MKSRFAVLAMVVMAAAPLAAQGGGGGGGMGGGMRGGGRGMNVDQLTTMYNLDATQKGKAQALVDDYTKNSAPLMTYLQSVRASSGTPDADSLKKQQMLRTDFNTKFKAILNADQAKMFDSVTAAQAARGNGRRGGGGK
jgi:hypothetical protein